MNVVRRKINDSYLLYTFYRIELSFMGIEIIRCKILLGDWIGIILCIFCWVYNMVILED
jgi:hypothetical protein